MCDCNVVLFFGVLLSTDFLIFWPQFLTFACFDFFNFASVPLARFSHFPFAVLCFFLCSVLFDFVKLISTIFFAVLSKFWLIVLLGLVLAVFDVKVCVLHQFIFAHFAVFVYFL